MGFTAITQVRFNKDLNKVGWQYIKKKKGVKEKNTIREESRGYTGNNGGI